MPSIARLNAQASIYETTIENAALEEALEERQRQKEAAKKARKAFKEADDVVKVRIADAELGLDATIRCGRFLLTERRVDEKEVSFTRGASKRLQISLLEDAA